MNRGRKSRDFLVPVEPMLGLAVGNSHENTGWDKEDLEQVLRGDFNVFILYIMRIYIFYIK